MYDYHENDPFRAQGEMDELRRRDLRRLEQGAASNRRVECVEAGGACAGGEQHTHKEVTR